MQVRSRIARGLILLLLAGSLGGCANDLADYEVATAKAAADLDAKTQQYVRETSVLDSVRETEQASLERRLLRAGAATDIRLSNMGLTGDMRQALLTKLRQSSDQYMADRQQSPSQAVALTSPTAPHMTDVVTALDKLSAPPSAIDNARELFAYFKEVHDDLVADKANKEAEGAVSAAGAPKPAAAPAK